MGTGSVSGCARRRRARTRVCGTTGRRSLPGPFRFDRISRHMKFSDAHLLLPVAEVVAPLG